MTCSLFFLFYHSSVNSVTSRPWYTSAFWEQLDCVAPECVSFPLICIPIPLCFLLIGLQEFCCLFSPSWEYPTVIITTSHPSPLPGQRKDYISQPSMVDKAMWLVLANGLRVEGSSDTPGWKHLRVSVWFSMFFLPSQRSIYWSGNAMEVATTWRAASPESCPDFELCRNKK